MHKGSTMAMTGLVLLTMAACGGGGGSTGTGGQGGTGEAASSSIAASGTGATASTASSTTSTGSGTQCTSNPAEACSCDTLAKLLVLQATGMLPSTQPVACGKIDASALDPVCCTGVTYSTVYCPAACSLPNQSCGETSYNQQTGITGIPNICGGGCDGAPTQGLCAGQSMKEVNVCNKGDVTSAPPPGSCTMFSGPSIDNRVTTWCCQ